MKLIDQKTAQKLEETALVEGTIHAELESIFNRMTLLVRTTALSPDEGTGVIVGCFNSFVASLSVECNETREEFLRGMGEEYDAAKEDAEPETEPLSEKEKKED
jgi:hypothetical protein